MKRKKEHIDWRVGDLLMLEHSVKSVSCFIMPLSMSSETGEVVYLYVCPPETGYRGNIVDHISYRELDAAIQSHWIKVSS